MAFRQVPNLRSIPTDTCAWNDEHDLPETIILWDLEYSPREQCRVFCDDDCESHYIDVHCEDGFY